MTEQDIIKAYITIRSTNNTIPDVVLDFMKDSAIRALGSPELLPIQIISNDRRLDMLVGALEGGSNYWYWLSDLSMLPKQAHESEKPLAEWIFYYLMNTGDQIPVHDKELQDEKPVGYISKANMDAAEKLMLEDDRYKGHLGDIISENDDATSADVWFQFVVMKEVIYG